jgi:hypothetical protein
MEEQDKTPSTITLGHLQKLVKHGFMSTVELGACRVLEDTMFPAPMEGYVVSFTAFYDRGFNVPPHQFFRSLLRYYGLELHHLTPTGVLHIAAFDEDMPTCDDSPVAIQGPITRACAHQLQYQVKSFLSSTPCQLQDRLLPKEILIVKNEGQAYEGLKNQQGGAQGCVQGVGLEMG